MFAKRTLAVIFAAGLAALVSPGVLAEGAVPELPEGAAIKVEVVEPPRTWLDRAPEWFTAFALLLGAVLGFSGATVYNHKLEIQRRKIERDDEAVMIACALYAELTQIWKDVRFVQVLCEHRQEGGLNIQSDEVALFDFHDLNYLENVPRLGLLGSQCSNLVVEVYGRAATTKKLVNVAGGGDPEFALAELGTILEALDFALSALCDFANELRPGTIDEPDV